MMKAVRCLLILSICAGLGVAFGHFCRKWKIPESESIVRIEYNTVEIEKALPVTSVELPLIAQLQRDLANSTGLTRRLLWLKALEKASLADFPQLARLADNDAAVLRMIAMRWIELDPKHLLNFLAEAGDRSSGELLSEVLFQEWAKRDPETLITELDAASSRGHLRSWRHDAAEYITRHHPRLGLPLFERWSLGMFTPSMRGVKKWAAENPREAAEFSLSIRSHYPATAAMKAVGEEWAKIDAVAAMKFTEGQENSLGRTLANSILKTWAERDLPAAAEWLAQTDESKRNAFSAPVVEQWARRDPAAALIWSEENLVGSSFTKAAASVIRGAAENDPEEAASLVLAMQPSVARSAAAIEVAKKILPGRDGLSAPPTEQTLHWLNSLDADATRRVLKEAVRSWPDADAEGMASFLLSTKVEGISSSVYLLVGRSLGRTDPEGALEWANRLPEEARLSGGSDAFARWCQSQPENAMRWLSNVPRSDARHSAYLKTALEYLAYEHNTAERVGALPLLDRTAALDLAKSMDLPEERRKRLLSALEQ